jgi:hypothetical protein
MPANNRDSFLEYCGVYKKFKAHGFYQGIGYTTLVTPRDFIMDKMEGLWSYHYKLPSGYVNNIPWFRFGEPFDHEVGFRREVFETVVDTLGENRMVIKLTPDKVGRRRIEIVLEFNPCGQMISTTHLMRREKEIMSIFYFHCSQTINNIKIIGGRAKV